MFFSHLLKMKRGARCWKSERRVIPRLEALEDRFVPAQFTWSGPANGLWSAAANWNPNGPPGLADTAIFNATDNNDSRMDLGNLGGDGSISVLKIQGYTGKIKLMQILQVDVLIMSSGTITTDPTAPQGTLFEVTQVQASSHDASSWTGGEIGGGVEMEFRLNGNQNNPLTFNLGDPNNTPVWSGGKWIIGDDCTVNWTRGNFTVKDGGALLGTIRNEGIFVATSTGTITKVGMKGEFEVYGTLTLKGKDRLNNWNLRKKLGGTINQQAALDGTPSNFTLVGALIGEGGSLSVSNGTFYVSGNFTESSGANSLGAGSATVSVSGTLENDGGSVTLTDTSSAVQVSSGNFVQTAGTMNVGTGTVSVTGDFDQSGGTTVVGGGNLTVTNTLNETGGVITDGLGPGITAQGGYIIGTNGTLNGYGPITVNGSVTNNGLIDVTLGSMQINGNYVQNSGGTLNLYISGTSTANSLNISGTATLYGTLNVFGSATIGDNFQLMTFASHVGTSDQMNLPAVPPPYRWQIVWSSNSLAIGVTYGM